MTEPKTDWCENCIIQERGIFNPVCLPCKQYGKKAKKQLNGNFEMSGNPYEIPKTPAGKYIEEWSKRPWPGWFPQKHKNAL